MRVFDSHCHLADARFADTQREVLLRAETVGVRAFVAVAAKACDWPRLVRLHHHFPQVGVALGLHPWFEHPPHAMARLPKWLQRTDAVAVGECGLDFGLGRVPREQQEALLLPQLRWARDMDLPVILHANKSEDVLAMHLARLPGLRGVVHGFHGSKPQADKFLRLGFYLGLGTAITYPQAQRLRALVASVSLDRVLLESDAPDQPPFGRAKPNEPAFVLDTLAVLADLHGLAVATVAEATWQNAHSLFLRKAHEVK
ncbi:MAG: TatD family hydrolase [Halothiobacillaceae bacterium]